MNIQNSVLALGIFSSIFLVLGVMWPEVAPNIPAHRSKKNILFAVGNLGMFSYAILGTWLLAAPPFFILLESLIALSTVFMLLETPSRYSVPVLSLTTTLLVSLSIFWAEDLKILWFVIGLFGLSIGFSLKPKGIQRPLALGLGSILLCIFSFIESSWVYFVLNFLFVLFPTIEILKSRFHSNGQA